MRLQHPSGVGVPARPAITFVSTYTGYTGSVTATRAFRRNDITYVACIAFGTIAYENLVDIHVYSTRHIVAFGYGPA